MHPDAADVYWSSNRGRSHMLHSNPHHAAELAAAGFPAAPAMFACAFDYLFAPTAATTALMAPWAPLLDRPDNFVVGVQIRTGDGAFAAPPGNHDDDAVLAPYLHFFRCANTLAAEFAQRRAMQVYLISDSVRLRQAAVRRFGAAVIADTNATVGHVNCAGDALADAPGCREAAHADGALQAVAAELLLFRKCDAFVITENSGLGKLGAWCVASVRRRPVCVRRRRGRGMTHPPRVSRLPSTGSTSMRCSSGACGRCRGTQAPTLQLVPPPPPPPTRAPGTTQTTVRTASHKRGKACKRDFSNMLTTGSTSAHW